MRYLLVILMVLAFVAARADDKVAASDFSVYPQTECFKAYLSLQTNTVRNLQQSHLLTISAFPNVGAFALEYCVTENGQENDCRNVCNWAIQSSHSKQLADADIRRLYSAIGELPSKSVMPPIERLVIISFRNGTNWTTRTYDSSTLPKPIHEIYGIIGGAV